MLYRFGTFEFDAEGGELKKNGRAVALEPQPAKVLALLLSRAGEMVSRDELREAVWGADTHVDFDRGIAYGISQVRAALSDIADNPRFVQTVPKQGFRFIAPVARDAPAAPDEGDAPAARDAPAKSFNRWVTIPLTLAMAAAAVGMLFESFSPAPPSHVAIAVSVFDNETGLA